MIITTTSIAFILLSVGLSFCGWLFLRSFQRTNSLMSDNKIGFLLTLLFLGFGFQNGIIGFGTFFFAESSEALFLILLGANLLLAVVAIIAVYTVYYILFPLKSPRLSIFLVAILGLNTILLNIFSHPEPSITLQKSIEWNTNFPLSISILLLLTLSIGATLSIFIRLFKNAKTREVKTLSAIQVILAIAGIVDALIRFLLLYNKPIALRASLYDFGIATIGTAFIVILGIGSIINNNKTKRKIREKNL